MKSKKDLKEAIDRARGTDFQKKVWKALLSIPEGELKTYEWLAARIGCPTGARAVGNAVGKNPLAPDVPCHRIVRKDGSLGGYSGRGGVRTKVRLLKEEGALPEGSVRTRRPSRPRNRSPLRY